MTLHSKFKKKTLFARLAHTAFGGAHRSSTGSEYVGVINNCLQATGLHDLLSLSQLQILPKSICSLANSDSYLTVNNIRFALHLINGVYELPYTILTRGDSRRYRLPHLV